MKKVIGAVLVASLVAGMAFADVAVTLNARLRSNMYHTAKKNGGATYTSLFDLDGGKYIPDDTFGSDTDTNEDAFKHGGSGTMSDTLAFKASNEYAGVVLEAAPTKSDLSTDTSYSGWLKFGALKFTFGTFDSRFVNRYNKTAGESGLLDSDDIAKYGTALLSADSKNVIKDANNFATVNGSKVESLVADYTVDAGDGQLLLKAGLLSNAYKNPEATDTDKSYTRAGYAFEADYQCDAANVQALVKLPKEKVTVFGVYADVKALPLPLAFGFTYGKDGNDYTSASAGVKGTAYAVDARVGYQVSDELNVASVIKYESIKPDGGKTDTALTVAAEVSYIVNDLATVFADVGYYNYNLGGEDAYAKKSVIKFRPGVVLTAGKDARVTAAFQYDSWSGDGRTLNNEMSIPVIFRVKM